MSGVTSGGGGGGALHTDGDPVSVQLGNGESVTVPSGETWVVTVGVASSNGNAAFCSVNGEMAVSALSPESTSASLEMTLVDEDTISSDSFATVVSGWSL